MLLQRVTPIWRVYLSVHSFLLPVRAADHVTPLNCQMYAMYGATRVKGCSIKGLRALYTRIFGAVMWCNSHTASRIINLTTELNLLESPLSYTDQDNR
jgi:hypothetical protein